MSELYPASLALNVVCYIIRSSVSIWKLHYFANWKEIHGLKTSDAKQAKLTFFDRKLCVLTYFCPEGYAKFPMQVGGRQLCFRKKKKTKTDSSVCNEANCHRGQVIESSQSKMLETHTHTHTHTHPTSLKSIHILKCSKILGQYLQSHKFIVMMHQTLCLQIKLICTALYIMHLLYEVSVILISKLYLRNVQNLKLQSKPIVKNRQFLI